MIGLPVSECTTSEHKCSMSASYLDVPCDDKVSAVRNTSDVQISRFVPYYVLSVTMSTASFDIIFGGFNGILFEFCVIASSTTIVSGLSRVERWLFGVVMGLVVVVPRVLALMA